MVPQGCTVVYSFDDNFTLLSAGAEDTFLNAHRDFYSNSLTNHPFSSKAEKEFRNVRCVAGCKTESVPVDIR